VYYHPRSSVQITEYELNSGIQPFEGYGLGQELFKTLNREHDLVDRDFRLFAEECDQMQGIQVVTSADDAWSGFTGEYLSELRDEYGKIGICTWGLERGDRAVKVSSPEFCIAARELSFPPALPSKQRIKLSSLSFRGHPTLYIGVTIFGTLTYGLTWMGIL
jgi:hypothetical protein